MAISYDSKGNPQVDFAWGNMPLQGNDQRGPLVPLYNNVADSYDPANQWIGPIAGGSNAFVASMQITPVIAGTILPGYAVDITTNDGKTVLISGTVKSVIAQGSLAGFVLNEDYTAANNNIFDTNNTAASQLKVKVYKKLNTGGGAGDKGWSTTTKVKSDVLDPALDNHVLATNGWNGYPGYTPGISVPPFNFSFDFSNLASGQYVYVNRESDYDDSDSGMWPTHSHGYYIRIPINQATGISWLGSEKYAELLLAITSGSIFGKRVAPMTLPDSYNNMINIPEGWVASASPVVNNYGGDMDIILTVFTNEKDAVPPMNTLYINNTAGVTLNISNEGQKSVVYTGEVGVDFTQISYNSYGTDAHGDYKLINPTDSAAILASVLPGDIVGAYVAGEGDNGMVFPIRISAIVVGTTTSGSDMYGVPEVVFNETETSYMMAQFSYAAQQGSKVYVIR